MRIIKQLFWIFLFSFMGEFLSMVSPVAVPGSVIGMVLLFLALHFKWINMEQVDEVGTWLTDNMAILFIPPGVGLMTNFDILGGVWWQLLIIVFVSTAAMLWFVGMVVQLMKKRAEEKQTKATAKGESING